MLADWRSRQNFKACIIHSVFDFITIDVDAVINMVVWDACRCLCWLIGDLGKNPCKVKPSFIPSAWRCFALFCAFM